jgi:hypothetical protein
VTDAEVHGCKSGRDVAYVLDRSTCLDYSHAQHFYALGFGCLVSDRASEPDLPPLIWCESMYDAGWVVRAIMSKIRSAQEQERARGG